jgi:hypothetical protein
VTLLGERLPWVAIPILSNNLCFALKDIYAPCASPLDAQGECVYSKRHILCASTARHGWAARRGTTDPRGCLGEQRTDFRFFFALVLTEIWPGSNRRFSPGWNHQLGLESPAQWIGQQTFAAGTFSPSLWFKPGLKITFQSRLEPPTGTKGLANFLFRVLAPTGTIGWSFSPGTLHQPGLKVPTYIYPISLSPSPRHTGQILIFAYCSSVFICVIAWGSKFFLSAADFIFILLKVSNFF